MRRFLKATASNKSMSKKGFSNTNECKPLNFTDKNDLRRKLVLAPGDDDLGGIACATSCDCCWETAVGEVAGEMDNIGFSIKGKPRAIELRRMISRDILSMAPGDETESAGGDGLKFA